MSNTYNVTKWHNSWMDTSIHMKSHLQNQQIYTSDMSCDLNGKQAHWDEIKIQVTCPVT